LVNFRYGVVMNWRGLLVTGVVGVTGVTGWAPIGTADPDPAPPPPLPNVNAYAPISPVDYTVAQGGMYAFAGPLGIVCVINRQSVSYGCSGPLPGAPGSANLVSGGESGAPAFASADRPIVSGPVKPLPPNTRLSFRDISCGMDGAGAIACVNSREQVGFVVGPAGSYIDDVNPLLDRPKGANPYVN